MVKSVMSVEASPDAITTEKAPKKMKIKQQRKRDLIIKGALLSKTGKLVLKGTEHLVSETVDLALDLTSRRGSNRNLRSSDPFALDIKMEDDFGTGNVKIFLKNQNKIPITFARLAKNDQSLQELTYRFIELNWKEFSLLALAVQTNTSLRKLTFYKSDISDGNAKTIADGIRDNSGLKELMFYQNRLTPKGSCSLCKAIGENSGITSFGFFKNSLGNAGMGFIMKALEDNPNINSINLFKNEIGPEGAMIMANILKKNHNFISLSMSHNKIGDIGATAIAEELKNQKRITNLALSGNGIGKEGGISISEALKNCVTLQKLDLNGNNMTDDGCIAIVKEIASKQSVITELDLSYNNLSESGALSIIRLLNQNTSLHDLKMKENELKNEVLVKQMKELMHRNQVISRHRFGVEEFGPFFYITVSPTETGDHTNGNAELVWTPRAWEAIETSDSTIDLLHQNIVILTNLGKNRSTSDTSEDSSDDEESLLLDHLQGSFVRSLIKTEAKNLASEEEGEKTDLESSGYSKVEEESCIESIKSKDTSNLNTLWNFMIRSSCNTEMINRLFNDCKDENGNTILYVVNKKKSEASIKLTQSIRMILNTGSDCKLGDSNHVSMSQCDATVANTIDDNDPWGENSKVILGRYKTENYPGLPKYKSDKSRVYSASDFQVDSSNQYRNVALKFFDKKEDFEKELSHRLGSRTDFKSGQDLIYKDGQNNLRNKNKFDDNYIIPIIRYHEEELCLVMPLGDRNLDDIIRNEAIAGIDLDSIRALLKSIAMSLRYLHDEHKMIHGNIKPRNFVRYNGQMRMIDFHKATPLNEPFKSKTSTGYIAPELAKGVFVFNDSKSLSYWANEEKKIMKKLIKLDRNADRDQEAIQLWEKKLEEVGPYLKRNSVSSLSSLNDKELNKSSATLDIWSFGVLSYYLLSGNQLFVTDQFDNIHPVDPYEQGKLLQWDGLNEVATSKIRFCPQNSIQHVIAIDLLRRCLHPDRNLRYSNMNQVLNHEFFINKNIQSTHVIDPEGYNELEDLPNARSPLESIICKKRGPNRSVQTEISNISIYEMEKNDSTLNDKESSACKDRPLPELQITTKASIWDKFKMITCIRG